MKAVALQKAVNVIKMDSWTNPVDFRYQDETSEFKIGCDQSAARKKGEVYVPKPWEGLPYLAKDDLGKNSSPRLLTRSSRPQSGRHFHLSRIAFNAGSYLPYPNWVPYAEGIAAH